MSRPSGSSARSSRSSSSSSSFGLGTLAVGAAVAAGVAAAAALYLAYTRDAKQQAGQSETKRGEHSDRAEDSEDGARGQHKSGVRNCALSLNSGSGLLPGCCCCSLAGKKKSKTPAAATPGAAAPSSAAAVAIPLSGPWTDDEFCAALHRDISARSAPNGKTSPQLERRIWANIRKMTEKEMLAYAQTTRTEIAQWIVAYHATLTAEQQSAAADDQHSARAERRSADYEIAWRCFASVEKEISEMANALPEQLEMRKDTELAMLDLAHKQRHNQRLITLYDRVRARSDPRDPSGYSEMEFFTLWMLSPLLGRWADFVGWADFMLSKGQQLDEFHHLAIQRSDLTDFSQMYKMVKEQLAKVAEAAERGDHSVTMWAEPSAADLEWGLFDIVGITWSFVSSTGSDEESSLRFVEGKKPLEVWKSNAPGLLNFRKMGANARIASMVSPQLPVVGPLLHNQSEFACSGSVMFRDNQHGLCRLNEEYVDFTRIRDAEEVRAMLKEDGPRRRFQFGVASGPATSAAAESGEAAAAAAAASSDAAASSPSAAAAAAATPFSTLSPSSSSSSPTAADSVELWSGRYCFEQVKIDEENPKAPSTEPPLLKVEYKVVLKIRRSQVQTQVL